MKITLKATVDPIIRYFQNRGDFLVTDMEEMGETYWIFERLEYEDPEDPVFGSSEASTYFEYKGGSLEFEVYLGRPVNSLLAEQLQPIIEELCREINLKKCYNRLPELAETYLKYEQLVFESKDQNENEI